jgi:antitoxin VapB
MTEAAIFMSGNSQAVRLPKSFRFNGKSVEIFRRGNEVVLREKRQSVAEVLKDLPPISKEDAEAFDQAMGLTRSEPAQERDWDQMLGSSAKP